MCSLFIYKHSIHNVAGSLVEVSGNWQIRLGTIVCRTVPVRLVAGESVERSIHLQSTHIIL